MSQRLIDLAPPVERAFLIAVDTGADAGWTASESIEELQALATTAGAEVVGAEWQQRRHVDPTWYLGKGKAEELMTARDETGFTLLVADDELSPRQQRSLEELTKVKVLDRSGLILDIFAQHARTHEGRLQVELAQLEYQLPRLTRLWTHLSRTGGGIGTRGPGETQLETDRRVIRAKIKKLKERVGQVARQRETTVRGRERRLVPTVAIVGYTNAGKSTMLNALVGTEAARAEDKLFATLDPTSRSVRLGDGGAAILTDTVGFIHKLPHQLIDAFRATLEEVVRADALLEIVDASDRHQVEHRATVQAVLDELGAGAKPRLVALNKIDLVAPAAGIGPATRNASAPRTAWEPGEGSDVVAGNGVGPGTVGPPIVGPVPIVGDAVAVSAVTGYGLATLRDRLGDLLASLGETVDVVVPYTAGELLARLREGGSVELDYRAHDVRVRGRVTPRLAGELRSAAASGTAPAQASR